MSRALHRIGAAIVGAIVAMATIAAVYNQFSPGGALSGTWNSQSVALDSGAFITGTLPSSNGGTANTFFSVSGPATSTKTYTFPNASTTVLTTNAAVTLAQGGTGLTSAADDTTLVSSGSAWAATAIPNCGDSTHALAYSTSGNAFSCQAVTGSGGAALTTGTWTTTFTTGCTTQPTQDWSYSQLGSGAGSEVTISSSALFNCTSNATTFTSASGSVPAAIRPSRTIFFPLVNMTDNSAQGSACLVLDSNGTLRYVVEEVTTSRCGVAAWTNSGSKQINMSSGAFGASTFTYRID